MATAGGPNRSYALTRENRSPSPFGQPMFLSTVGRDPFEVGLRTSEVGVGNRRTVILIVAVIAAVVAAGAIYGYLNSVQDRAYADAKLVKVYRVDKDVKKGLPGEQAIDQG